MLHHGAAYWYIDMGSITNLNKDEFRNPNSRFKAISYHFPATALEKLVDTRGGTHRKEHNPGYQIHREQGVI
jgi:hypothetical protein